MRRTEQTEGTRLANVRHATTHQELQEETVIEKSTKEERFEEKRFSNCSKLKNKNDTNDTNDIISLISVHVKETGPDTAAPTTRLSPRKTRAVTDRNSYQKPLSPPPGLR